MGRVLEMFSITCQTCSQQCLQNLLHSSGQNALSGTALGLLKDRKDGKIIAACIMLNWL
jgi:hypothetical protein